MATETSDVGPLERVPEQRRALLVEQRRDHRPRAGHERRLPEVTTVCAKPPFSLSVRIAETTWNEPMPSSPSFARLHQRHGADDARAGHLLLQLRSPAPPRSRRAA